MKTTKLVMLVLCAAFVVSCSNDSEDDLTQVDQEQTDDEGTQTELTYDNTVKAIIDGSCIGCHDSPPRNGAPFALVNYQQVSQRANAILNAMSRQNGSAGAMPPSGRLPQNTINQIQEWIDNDTPEN